LESLVLQENRNLIGGRVSPTLVRACQIDACSERVPPSLSQQGVCLSHYLDEAFTRIASALATCRRGEPLDSRTIEWMTKQGDFAVRQLSNGSHHSSEERARLLELLLGLANLREYTRQEGVAKVS